MRRDQRAFVPGSSDHGLAAPVEITGNLLPRVPGVDQPAAGLSEGVTASGFLEQGNHGACKRIRLISDSGVVGPA